MGDHRDDMQRRNPFPLKAKQELLLVVLTSVCFQELSIRRVRDSVATVAPFRDVRCKH